MNIDKLKTVYSTGAFINNVKVFFKKINEIIDYLNGNPIPTVNYKVYRARLSHSGTPNDIPLEVDFEGNTSSAITDEIGGFWSYDSVGLYIYTKTGLCTDLTKIDVVITNNRGIPYNIVWGKNNDNSIYIETRKVINFTTTPISFSGMDGVLYITPIEIRIYN